jgi:hypothetical protein
VATDSGQSPLYPKLKLRIQKATDHLVQTKLQPWCLLSNGLNVTRSDGRTIAYSGCKYSGSPRTVFWSNYIEPFIKDLVVREISDASVLAEENALDAFLVLHEAGGLLRGASEKLFDQMAEIDRRLLGDGFPQKVPLRSVAHEKDVIGKFIDSHVEAEIRMFESRRSARINQGAINEIRISSSAQKGGITAHNVTINHNGPSPQLANGRRPLIIIGLFLIGAIAVLSNMATILDWLGISPAKTEKSAYASAAVTPTSLGSAIPNPMTTPQNITISSVNQSGGITAHTVNIDGKSFQPELENRWIAQNKPEGNVFTSAIEITLVTQFPVANLVVEVHVENIEAFDVALSRPGALVLGPTGKRPGFGFANIPNASGKYILRLTTSKPITNADLRWDVH